MTLKLAHQSVPGPDASPDAANQTYVLEAAGGSSLVYFQWNHINVSQFMLVDVEAKGWTMAFVPGTVVEAEHILLSAPPSWATPAGEAYLIVNAEMPAPDYEVVALHGPMVNASEAVVDAEAGPIARYVDSDNFITAHYQVANIWDYPTDFCTAVKEAGWYDYLRWFSFLPVIEDSTCTLRTSTYVYENIVGGGYAAPLLFNTASIIDPALMTDRTVGFGCFWLGGDTGGGEYIKIYDLFVRKAQ